MRSNDERLKRIFQKAKEKQRKQKIWARTAIITALCLVCTVTGVAVVLSNPDRVITVLPQTDSNGPTTLKPHSRPAQTIVPNSSSSGASQNPSETVSAGESAPPVSESAPAQTTATPTEPSLGDRPAPSAPATKPAQTEPPAQTTEPALDDTEPPEPTEEMILPTVPVLPDDLPTEPQLETPDNGESSDGESPDDVSSTVPSASAPYDTPVVEYFDSTYETAFLHAFQRFDTEDGAPKRRILISDAFAQKADEAAPDAVLRARIYANTRQSEDVIDFLERSVLSYTLSGDSYLVYLTGEQAQSLGEHTVPDSFYLLITSG